MVRAGGKSGTALVVGALFLTGWNGPGANAAMAQTGTAERRAAIDARLSRIEAIKAIERLQYAYGYYQDRFFFAEVASLFAGKNPTVQWGDAIWTGQPAVRRFWMEYMRPAIAGGASGPVAGKLFDLPQWQGVITIDADGRGASARFNSIGRYAVYREKEYWISGFYQNRYALEDGVWKIRTLKFCPNWSAPYTAGWRDISERDASAWMPPIPRSAKPTRAASATDRCPTPYPGNRQVTFDFDDPAQGGRP